MNDAKMSKSLGNVVRPQSYTKVFGVDAFRYFVLREMMFGQDANFSDEAFLTRYNADLANDLGNLVSRATTMIHRYCGGAVPESRAEHEDHSLSQRLKELGPLVTARMSHSYQFSMALRDIWDVISLTNKYIAAREPWALARDPSKRDVLNAVLYQSAEVLRVVAALVEPAMPSTSARIRKMLGIEAHDWRQLQRRAAEAWNAAWNSRAAVSENGQDCGGTSPDGRSGQSSRSTNPAASVRGTEPEPGTEPRRRNEPTFPSTRS